MGEVSRDSVESGLNNRRSADVSKIHQGSNVRKRASERETRITRSCEVNKKFVFFS